MADRSTFVTLGRGTAVFLTLLLAASGPIAADEDPRDREIALLKKRVLALRQQVVVDRVELDRLRQEVAALKEALAATSSDGRPIADPAPIAAPIAPQPAIETSELDPAPARPPAAPPSPGAGAGPLADDLQAVYDDGYTLFHQKRYAEAEARFAAFLARSGDDDLSDNAQFWIGECRYARGQHGAALEAFTAVVERYPKGNKVPDAMVKAGKTLAAMGDLDAARATYSEVRSRFPGTAAAAVATELLERLP